MPKKEKQSNSGDNFFERDIDPRVSKKVEQIMGESPEGKPILKPSSQTKAASETETPVSGAPLLPSEKLPPSVAAPIGQAQDEEKPPSPSKSPIAPTESTKDTSDLENHYTDDDMGLEDPATEKAVNEIVSEEADQMLAIEDAKTELLAGSKSTKEGFFARLRSKITGKGFRGVFIGLIFLAIIVAAAVPTSRYFMLNLAGVRASTSLRVVDSVTDQPLKNVDVAISGVSAKTDIDGYVRLEHIKLGQQELFIKKPAFAETKQTIVIGWGSNPLGDIDLKAVGSQYSFLLTDFLSGKPIANAEVISGEASALSDKDGKAMLVVEDSDEKDVSVEVKAGDYRTENLTLPVGTQEAKEVSMVPARKHAFISKRDGKYDLYKIDVDGKYEEKILPGTGLERADEIVLLHHTSKNIVALVSTRENLRSADGQLLSGLNIVDLNSNDITQVAQSERLQLIDFIGDKLIYVKIAKNAKKTDTKRHKLMSYDIVTGEEKELASTNYFNDVLAAKGVVYYSPAAYKINGSVGFYKINPDGTGKENIFEKEAWNLFRVNYDKLHVSVGHDWYDYDLNSGQFDKLDGAPPSMQSRIYTTGNNDEQSIWVDERDGKGVLLLHNSKTGKDTALQSAGGLQGPVRWLDDDHIVYRINNSSETADYAMSLGGGDAQKIRDVTDTVGLDRWYYY